jgi:hypothetical protein
VAGRGERPYVIDPYTTVELSMVLGRGASGGPVLAWSGALCVPVVADRLGDGTGVAVAGNMLADGRVVSAAGDAFGRSGRGGAGLGDRLLAALRPGSARVGPSGALGGRPGSVQRGHVRGADHPPGIRQSGGGARCGDVGATQNCLRGHRAARADEGGHRTGSGE